MDDISEMETEDFLALLLEPVESGSGGITLPPSFF
jgi:hypothetical protein